MTVFWHQHHASPTVGFCLCSASGCWGFEWLSLLAGLMQWAVTDIDADAPENANGKPELEPGEFIDVFLVPLAGLHKSLAVSPIQQ